jgi:predicted RNA-binding protein Jag
MPTATATDKHAEQIEQDVRALLSLVVDEADTIKTRCVGSQTRLVIEVEAGGQTRFMIGRNGSNVKHLRHLMDIIGNKHRRLNGSPYLKIDVDIIDNR